MKAEYQITYPGHIVYACGSHALARAHGSGRCDPMPESNARPWPPECSDCKHAESQKGRDE